MRNTKKRQRIPFDKRAHALAGVIVALASAPLGYWLLPGYAWPGSPVAAGVVAVIAAVLAGLLKEVFDGWVRGGRHLFDEIDWLYTAGGGLPGGVVVTLSALPAGGDPATTQIAGLTLLALASACGLLIVRMYARRRA